MLRCPLSKPGVNPAPLLATAAHPLITRPCPVESPTMLSGLSAKNSSMANLAPGQVYKAVVIAQDQNLRAPFVHRKNLNESRVG